MRKTLIRGSALLLAAATQKKPKQTTTQDTPHRSSQLPPGLAKAFAKGTPGIMRAIIATQGSNSRLQDLPASP